MAGRSSTERNSTERSPKLQASKHVLSFETRNDRMPDLLVTDETDKTEFESTRYESSHGARMKARCSRGDVGLAGMRWMDGLCKAAGLAAMLCKRNSGLPGTAAVRFLMW